MPEIPYEWVAVYPDGYLTTVCILYQMTISWIINTTLFYHPHHFSSQLKMRLYNALLIAGAASAMALTP